jgi:hypothetical protein
MIIRIDLHEAAIRADKFGRVQNIDYVIEFTTIELQRSLPSVEMRACARGGNAAVQQTDQLSASCRLANGLVKNTEIKRAEAAF